MKLKSLREANAVIDRINEIITAMPKGSKRDYAKTFICNFNRAIKLICNTHIESTEHLTITSDIVIDYQLYSLRLLRNDYNQKLMAWKERGANELLISLIRNYVISGIRNREEFLKLKKIYK